MNRWAKLVIVLAVPMAAQAEDPRLAEIRVTLQHIREEGPRHEQTRGASPELTAVKHELRDWVAQRRIASRPSAVFRGEALHRQ